MRDLIRNYSKLVKGIDIESDTENESQPLMSSSSSLNKSFGAVREPLIFKNDSDTDQLETENSYSNHHPTINTIPSILTEKKINSDFVYTPNYDSTKLDKYIQSNNSIYKNEDQNFNFLRQNSIISYFNDYKDSDQLETHSSVVTIFAIWNTTVGTSLLSMSWGIQHTGLFPAIIINLLIAAICLYTTFILLKINEKHGSIGTNNEVCDLCKLLLGRWAEILAKIFSAIVLIGANIVYWILMSNFLFNSVHFFHGLVTSSSENRSLILSNNSVICPKEIILLNSTVNLNNLPELTFFDLFWDLYSTVPILLAIIMFPLLNWKSATFFTKFNSVGTLSVLYLIIFVATKAINWGINIPDWNMEFYLKPTFCALTGMLSLSYFIHNIIISIMKNNHNQEKNGRDLTIAFGLITFTYLFIGVIFYVTFPLAKACIEDNILNNFDKYDTLTIIARILLLFQLSTVFPLLSFMLRNEILININMIFKNYRFGDFTYGRVIFLNTIILIICVLFACFLPKIGTLIRYTGALSGLVYIFMLPSLLKIASMKKEGKLTLTQLILNVIIIIIGFINLISQFFITDK